VVPCCLLVMNFQEGKRVTSLFVTLQRTTFTTFSNHLTFSIHIIRYARWSLGFVDPPLEISGKGNQCKISALNVRGQVLLEPVMEAMNKLLASGTLSDITRDGDVIDIQVAPPADVGTFSEEERSRQVSYVFISAI
jgi:hypothetical protein